MDKLFHKAQIGMLLSIGCAFGVRETLPQNFFQGKLFPDNYPLKCKYIYPWRVHISGVTKCVKKFLTLSQ